LSLVFIYLQNFCLTYSITFVQGMGRASHESSIFFITSPVL
jgi:hypothetical protein